MQIFHKIQKLPQKQIIILGYFLILMIGSFDYFTGSEISFSVFYLTPIALLAWTVSDRRVSFLSAILCSVVWLIVDQLGDRVYSSSLIPFWNAGVRLGFFTIVAFTLSSLRAANDRREELAHFIVHDLRAPLSNIISGLSLLLEISGDTLDQNEKELVTISLASAKRMLSLVNSLLDLGQLENGRLELNRQQSDIGEMFETTVQHLSALAERSDVNLITKIETGAESIYADSSLVIRMLVNIVSNALKFSPKGSTVRLEAVSFSETQVAIQVIDEGSGIPKEWADKVFEKFAQFEAKKKGITIGNGLGLTFCRLAVEAHGGRIWLTSEMGQGTTVTFTLAKHGT